MKGGTLLTGANPAVVNAKTNRVQSATGLSFGVPPPLERGFIWSDSKVVNGKTNERTQGENLALFFAFISK